MLTRTPVSPNVEAKGGGFLPTALRNVLEIALAQQYEIIRPLGEGGMASVFLARERNLERFVAIKVLRPDLALAEGHRERFRREARTVAGLSHPGILALHSFGEIDNLWYIVMSYVRGETLADRVKREGRLPWTEAHRIFSELADALYCAHRNGIVHRDIKPANILLDSDTGHAILADFGISKIPGAAESLTASGAIIGTPEYMSPEQVTADGDIDDRSDIYSLGAVAYVMLTGQEPFSSAVPGRTLYRRLVEDAAAVDSIVPSIPADLSSIVQRCMARDRNARWPNARSLREALDGIVEVNRLPEIVRDLPSFGAYSLLWVVGWGAFAYLTDRSTSERVLLTIVALIAPIGLVLHLWNGAGRGTGLKELARVALWPPEWWSMWWPRILRRPADVWARLPWVARATRIVISLAVPVLLVLMLMRAEISKRGAGYDAWVGGAEWGIAVLAAGVVAAAFLWAQRRGIGLADAPRLLLGPTLASSQWSEPSLARVLAPASGNVRAPERDSPADYLRAIRELVAGMPASRADVGSRILSAADCLLKAINRADRELESVSRDAGPGEEMRLSAQLDALCAGETRGDTGEREELRELVRHQLDLVRRMQMRKEIVLRERGHNLDLLRALWTLGREAGDASVDVAGLKRLEALCAEVSLELGPLDATRSPSVLS